VSDLPEMGLRRCEITGNECGTDTRAIIGGVMSVCRCVPCQRYNAAHAERERILALLREPSEEFVNHLAGTSPDWWGPTAAGKRRKVRADLLAIATEIGGEG
jgi:hypothetical protein